MRLSVIVLPLALVLLSAEIVSAQDQPASAEPQQQLLDAAQLDQLVAPIALYSDPLLAQVLMASTYPLEVVQADRWAKSNKGLKGDKLTDALEKQDWDASVKQLVSTPSVLTMMNDKLDWTQALGDAVLAQQADVMDAIQRLRAKAQANGKLETTKQQRVTVKQDQGSAPIRRPRRAGLGRRLQGRRKADPLLTPICYRIPTRQSAGAPAALRHPAQG